MTPNTPLLFLDIDGVMNTTDSCLRHRSGEVFADEPMNALRWLVSEIQPAIVITSTRRRAGLPAMRQLLASNRLLVASACLTGLTPLLHEHDSDELREEEILQWLEAKAFPNQSFIILDDKALKTPLSACLLQTKPERGLTMEHARLAPRILTHEAFYHDVWRALPQVSDRSH